MLLGLNCLFQFHRRTRLWWCLDRTVCFSFTEGRGCGGAWTELFVSVSQKDEAVVVLGLNCLFQFHRRARLWWCLD